MLQDNKLLKELGIINPSDKGLLCEYRKANGFYCAIYHKHIGNTAYKYCGKCVFFKVRK